MKLLRTFLAAFCALLMLAACKTAADAAGAKDYIHQENFSADYKLQGLFATCYQSFQAGSWEIRNAELTLYYTATMLVKENISDFTVSINGRPVYSQKISESAGETQKLTVPVPVECIQEGINQIMIQSCIRTNEADPCQDDVTQANWMMILKESFVTVHYEKAVDCAGISDVYGQLTSIEAMENKESAVLVSQNPSEAELTAAAYALSGISANAPLSYENMDFAVLSDYDGLSEWQYILYISSYDDCLPEILAGMKEEQKKAAGEDAALVWMKGPKGQDILAAVGGNPEALINACRLLGNRANMEQTSAAFRRVRADERVTILSAPASDQRLTESGSYVSGPFRQTMSFYIEQAANRKTGPGSRMTLKYRYSENLDFNRSLVTIFVGDTPIGSRKLEKAAANQDSFTVDIPDNLGVTGAFHITVIFDLEIADMACTMRPQDMPWAYVTNESSLDIKTEEIPWLLFDFYPSPFVKDGRLNEVVIILPAKESKADLSAFSSLLLTAGRYLKDNSGQIGVRRADNPGDLSKSNVISIGKIGSNPIAEQLNDQLYFRFSPKRTTVLSNEKMQIAPDYGAGLGTAQLLYSPYASGEYSLLVLSGVTDEAMSRAAAYLGSVENNWKLFGDGFAADRETVYCYRFGEDNAKKQALSARLKTQTDLLRLIITGGCLTFLILCAFILLLRKYRKNGGGG